MAACHATHPTAGCCAAAQPTDCCVSRAISKSPTQQAVMPQHHDQPQARLAWASLWLLLNREMGAGQAPALSAPRWDKGIGHLAPLAVTRGAKLNTSCGVVPLARTAPVNLWHTHHNLKTTWQRATTRGRTWPHRQARQQHARSYTTMACQAGDHDRALAATRAERAVRAESRAQRSCTSVLPHAAHVRCATPLLRSLHPTPFHHHHLTPPHPVPNHPPAPPLPTPPSPSVLPSGKPLPAHQRPWLPRQARAGSRVWATHMCAK